MLNQNQPQLDLYADFYDKIIPKDNLLRRIKELVDFSFIYEELESKYCLINGRNAESPIKLFKYLLLKCIAVLSDVDVVEQSRYDMSFKKKLIEIIKMEKQIAERTDSLLRMFWQMELMQVKIIWILQQRMMKKESQISNLYQN